MDDNRINQAVGAELRAARARQGWTREQLEEASGVPIVSIRRYEGGTRSIPVDTLVKLVSALKISISDIDKAIRAASSDPPSGFEPAPEPRRRDASDIQNRIPRSAKSNKRGKNATGFNQ
ncbi:immunity repressor [Mycobacterium phage Sparky]|uniref:Immunity repressor n=1 Tax=Mycobacterium phage Sparky TaxID=1527493 RepID=A0A076G7U2_9CAUD|nr:immunity repressor [Mycobacterium phage Sparky]AII28191.1 immunity repressor [Mycobacterium phage Sparky]